MNDDDIVKAAHLIAQIKSRENNQPCNPAKISNGAVIVSGLSEVEMQSVVSRIGEESMEQWNDDTENLRFELAKLRETKAIHRQCDECHKVTEWSAGNCMDPNHGEPL